MSARTASHTLPGGHRTCDTQSASAAGDFSPPPPANAFAEPDAFPPVAAPNLPDGHTSRAAQACSAAGDLDPPAPAIEFSQPNEHALVPAPNLPDGHTWSDTQRRCADGDTDRPAPAMVPSRPSPQSPGPANPFAADDAVVLALLADVLDDLERTRIANENRLRQLTRDQPDRDGEERGFGLTLDQPQVAALADIVTAIAQLEHQATLNLQRAMRKHPLGPWVKATVGVGEKQGARLIAAIGDPYWNTLHDRPRLVSELWAYAGLHVLPAAHGLRAPHDKSGGGAQLGGPGQVVSAPHVSSAGVAPTRTRGQRANWSTTAKTRAYLVAESCITHRSSPYRAVYDQARAQYAQAVHQVPCRRCGPSGHPAAPGSPLSAGHQHARAMRRVMKELLRDLWAQAKHLHQEAR